MGADSVLCRFSHQAMSTVFETVIAGERAAYARQASEEVFREIDRLEGLLSRFDPSSDVARISRLEPGGRLPVSLDTYQCLLIAAELHAETAGAFDVTVGSLMDCIRDETGKPATTSEAELECARARVGMGRLVLARGAPPGSEEPETITPPMFSVGIEAPRNGSSMGMISIDLGGIGKGYALDRSLDVLRRWGISSALIHAGSSTAVAAGSGGEPAGCPPGVEGWPVAAGGAWGRAAGLDDVLLRDQAVSGSGTEVKGAHILDPRTAKPARGHAAAWVAAPSAALADALSTAFMVMTTAEVEAFCRLHPEVSAILVETTGTGERVRLVGGWKHRA